MVIVFQVIRILKSHVYKKCSADDPIQVLKFVGSALQPDIEVVAD